MKETRHYMNLNPGDTIKFGDEFLSHSDIWLTTECAGYEVESGDSYRRLIKKTNEEESNMKDIQLYAETTEVVYHASGDRDGFYKTKNDAIRAGARNTLHNMILEEDEDVADILISKRKDIINILSQIK